MYIQLTLSLQISSVNLKLCISYTDQARRDFAISFNLQGWLLYILLLLGTSGQQRWASCEELINFPYCTATVELGCNVAFLKCN